MKKSLITLLLGLVIGSCAINPKTEKLSWLEKQIAALNYSKNENRMDMATQIKNQKICEDYGKSKWEEIGGFGDWNIFREFRYSPLYDKCFVKSENENFKMNQRSVSVMDALTEQTLFKHNSWCKDSYKEYDIQISPDDIEEECPSELTINNAWNSLIGE